MAINSAGGTRASEITVLERGARLDSLGAALMTHATSDVQSRGNVSATFQVPRLVTIPSDGEKHTFTIVQLNLEAEMSWVVVPKKDLRVHLKVG
jgi:hypothetical protein